MHRSSTRGAARRRHPLLGRDPRVLDREEERELAIRWRQGDSRAGDKLVESCLPFVLSIALEHRRWCAPLEDMVQQGTIGLLHAARRYDPAKGYRLASYAAAWIRAEIRKYLVHAYRLVRFGTTKAEKRAVRIYRMTGERDPQRLAERAGLSVQRAEALLPLLAFGHDSLDGPVRDGASMADRLSADVPTPEDRLGTEIFRFRVAAAVERLSARDQFIARERLMSDEPPSFAQLGEILGISGERVRQLEVRIRERLRVELAPLHRCDAVGSAA